VLVNVHAGGGRRQEASRRCSDGVQVDVVDLTARTRVHSKLVRKQSTHCNGGRQCNSHSGDVERRRVAALDKRQCGASGHAVLRHERKRGGGGSGSDKRPIQRQSSQSSANKTHSSRERVAYRVWSSEETQKERMVVTSSTSDDVNASGNASSSSVFSLTTNCQLAALSS
jgi:hypothetical protein